MAKSTKIDKIASIEKLDYILDNVTKHVDERRIEACVDSLKKEKDINKLLRLFSEMNNTFAEETDVLREQAPTYNKDYSTPINGRYSLAYNSLVCIKKQIFFLYRIMNVLSRKPSSNSNFITTDTNTLEYSVSHTMLGTLPYQLSLFNDRSETQNRLIREIKDFLGYLDNNLGLCKQVVEEEQRIGNDEREVYERFTNQLNQVYNYVKGHKFKPRNIEADYYKDLLDSNNNGNLRKWWHKLQPSEFIDVACGILDSELSGYTSLERKVFNEDPGKIKFFRSVVSHIDECGKITGKVLVYVCKYTECQAPQATFHKCFVETYTNMGGQQSVVTKAMYNQAVANTTKHGMPDYPNFELTMNKYCCYKG